MKALFEFVSFSSGFVGFFLFLIVSNLLPSSLLIFSFLVIVIIMILFIFYLYAEWESEKDKHFEEIEFQLLNLKSSKRVLLASLEFIKNKEVKKEMKKENEEIDKAIEKIKNKLE